MASAGFKFLEPLTPEEEVVRVLGLLADGAYAPATLEGSANDLKEDTSRRDQETGAVLAGATRPKNMVENLARGAAFNGRAAAWGVSH